MKEEYLVAIPRKGKAIYDVIAKFETPEAAESYCIKIQDAIVVYPLTPYKE